MDVSVNGSVPAKSKDSIVRQGMPDLNPTLEIGPSLNVHFYYSEDKKTNFDMRMPLRSVTATDFKHFQNAGWLFQLGLEQPTGILEMLEIGCGNRAQWHSHIEVGLLVFGVIEMDVERRADLQRRIQVRHALSHDGVLALRRNGTVHTDIHLDAVAPKN